MVPRPAVPLLQSCTAARTNRRAIVERSSTGVARPPRTVLMRSSSAMSAAPTAPRAMIPTRPRATLKPPCVVGMLIEHTYYNLPGSYLSGAQHSSESQQLRDMPSSLKDFAIFCSIALRDAAGP